MSQTPDRKPGHARLLLMLGGIAVGMFGFGFALVPLYDVFCEVTGIRMQDGNGRIAESELKTGQADEERWVTVTFDSSVEQNLPWDFGPEKPKMKVKVGELTEAMFTASNQADAAVIGHAVPSIAPAEASIYFAKTECFCFTQQALEAGETREMPVRFVIDPELPRHIRVLTLSYRFYNNEQATAERAAQGLSAQSSI